MLGAGHNLFNNFQIFLFCSSSLSRNYHVSLLMTNLTQIQFEMNLVKENDSFLWRSVLNGVVFILCI